MIDHFKGNQLLDLYAPLLTDRQREICILYFEEDLSLMEIAQELHISKAAVQDSLSKSVKTLLNYEKNLRLLYKRGILESYIAQHPEAASLMEELF